MSRTKEVKGPWVVLAVFAIIAAAGVGVLLWAMNAPPPPEQPAPPEASLVPRVIDVGALDAGAAPPSPK